MNPETPLQTDNTPQEPRMSTSNIGCGRCTKLTTKKCGKCKNMRYCSEECQSADWINHKTLCASFKDFLTPPTPLHRRAIIFRPNAARPEFIWVRVEVSENEDKVDEDGEFSDDIGIPSYDLREEHIEHIQFDGLFAPAGSERDPALGCMDLVQGSMGQGQNLDHTIHAWHKDEFMSDDSNLCLSRMTGGETGGRFRGTIVFTGMSKVEDSTVYRDLDTADLTIALKGMTEYSKKVRMAWLTSTSEPRSRHAGELGSGITREAERDGNAR